MTQSEPEFRALRAPTRPARIAVLIAGPLLWIAALVIVAIVAGQTDLILVGLVIAAGSFLLGLVYLLLMRAQRLKREREDVRGPRG